jgi:hypothetical protein
MVPYLVQRCDGNDERDVADVGVGKGGQGQGHMAVGATSVECGNGGGVSHELALGMLDGRVGRWDGEGGDRVEDFGRKVAQFEMSRGRHRDRRGCGWAGGQG